MLSDYQDTFSKDEFDLGLTNLIEHSIDDGNSKPIKQPPRRVPVAFAAKEEKVIQQLQKQGVIRKSTSPWASPIYLVRKKSGKVRPCVDYRKLNEITKKDAFPLPRISDCLDASADAKHYSTFDLTSGFHQISIQEQDIEKTAFCTKNGLFEYLTIPMGLTNSPGVFQRLMEIVLRGLQWHTCLIYLDDVLVFGSNFDEHMDRVREVLSRIRGAELKLKPEKCQSDNLSKERDWPIPTTPTQVRQILGLGSYYRRFIKGYSDLVRPLTLLTHKDQQFIWTPKCQKAFDDLKEKLTSSELMAYPRNEGLYILDTDASDTQIAAVLSQMQDGKECVISYGSRTLNKVERNYCITDKELLGVRHFTEYYRQYLLGRKFLVRSDHQALTFLFKLKELKSSIARWIEILSAFDFSIEFRRGRSHRYADALSRCPDPWDCKCEDIDNLESLKCRPCKKCVKRQNDMLGDDCGHTTQSVRAVTTRSRSTANPSNMWSLEQDKLHVQSMQMGDPDIVFIRGALEREVRPPHTDVVALSPAAR